MRRTALIIGIAALCCLAGRPANATVTTVTNVSSATANGTYGLGANISIQVSFSGAVTVTGGPQLSLNSGGTGNYSGGNGTSTLSFTYVVGAGQNSADLDYASTSSLSLNGGTILDLASAPAVLTLPAPGGAGSLGANKDIVINTRVAATPEPSSLTLMGIALAGFVGKKLRARRKSLQV